MTQTHQLVDGGQTFQARHKPRNLGLGVGGLLVVDGPVFGVVVQLDPGRVDGRHQLLDVRQALEGPAALVDKLEAVAEELQRPLTVLDLVDAKQGHASPA